MYTYYKPDNLVELIETSVANYAQRPLFGTPDTKGNYTWVNYAAVGHRIDDLRAGLADIGTGKGDTVGVIARNRVEWAIAAFATFGLGGRFIPRISLKGTKFPEAIYWTTSPSVLKTVC